MKTGNWLKFTSLFFGLLVVGFLLFSVYIHTHMTAGLPDGPPLQLSRIDFQEKLDSTTALRIRQAVQSMPGVDHAYCNIPDGILVYSHDPKTQPAQAVFAAVTQRFALPAERFVVSETMAASSCPVTGDRSVFMQVGAFLARAF